MKFPRIDDFIYLTTLNRAYRKKSRLAIASNRTTSGRIAAVVFLLDCHHRF